jgi:hypothetical protein
MKKTLLLLILFSFFSCQQKNQNTGTITSQPDSISAIYEKVEDIGEPVVSGKPLTDLVPDNFVIFEIIYGDLNNDGMQDCVLIIKDTDKENIIDDENRGTLDRNRRGIIIAFNKGGSYEPVARNYSCFSSENEDGGVYFAPELDVYVNEKGNLSVFYRHGRYGHWGYIFRYQNNAFELIGYSSETNRGPVGLFKTSINFSTGKEVKSVNLDQDCESGDEKWEDTWTDIDNRELIKLDDIRDFDNINLDSTD